MAGWLDAQRSENTRAAYRRDIERFMAWCDVQRLGPLRASSADIAAFRTSAANAELSASTIGRQVSAIASFYRFAAEHGWAVPSMASVERPLAVPATETASLGRRQAEAVWAAALELGPKTASIVGLALFDGLKLNETLMLNVVDVTMTKPMHVALSARGGVRVRLDDRTAAVVRRQARGRADGPLFLGGGTGASRRMTRFGADYVIRRAGQEAGLDAPLSSNTLRRTHVVAAYASGASVDEIRDALGHVDRRTTRRYLPTAR